MLRPNQILKHRIVKIALDLLLVLAVYFAVRTYMQYDLVKGSAPSLQGNLLSGEMVNLQSLRGQAVMVHFWANWCKVCKLEQNSIDAISKDHTVITVAMNSGAEAEVKKYLVENALSFPVIVDADSSISNRFGVKGVPTSFVIDADGNIAFTDVGYTTEAGLRLRLWLAGN